VLLARLPAPLKFLPCCLCMQNIDNKDPSSLFAPLTRPRKSFALLAPRLMSEVGMTHSGKVVRRPTGSSRPRVVQRRCQWLTLPVTRAILRYMVKYKASAMDRTFSALADPTRRGVLLRLKEEPGLSVSELARPFSLKLPGLMKHLDVLSDAGLITRAKSGRTVSVHLSVGPMREAMEWLKRYERFWTVSIDRLVALVEEDGER
jgi:DNA-binding transcriptional ArsR family regulator